MHTGGHQRTERSSDLPRATQLGCEGLGLGRTPVCSRTHASSCREGLSPPPRRNPAPTVPLPQVFVPGHRAAQPLSPLCPAAQVALSQAPSRSPGGPQRCGWDACGGDGDGDTARRRGSHAGVSHPACANHARSRAEGGGSGCAAFRWAALPVRVGEAGDRGGQDKSRHSWGRQPVRGPRGRQRVPAGVRTPGSMREHLEETGDRRQTRSADGARMRCLNRNSQRQFGAIQ